MSDGRPYRRIFARSVHTVGVPLRHLRRLAPVVFVVGGSLGLAACGGGSTDAGGLTPQEVRGQQIARSAGCSSCHGADGQGGLGPAWIDLPGSEVLLADGTTVIADDEYLFRSIRDPQAELVAGWRVTMTRNNLSDSQIEDVIAFIKTFTSEPPAEAENTDTEPADG